MAVRLLTSEMEEKHMYTAALSQVCGESHVHVCIIEVSILDMRIENILYCLMNRLDQEYYPWQRGTSNKAVSIKRCLTELALGKYMDIVNYSQAGKANAVNTTQGSSPITSDNSTSQSVVYDPPKKGVKY